MAAVVVWRSKHRRNLKRNRVFRDRRNPLDMYDDVELYDKFRIRRHDILTIVDELRDDLEYPDTRQGPLPATLQVVVALRMYASLFLELGGWDHRHRPVNRIPNHLPCDQRFGRSDAWVDTATDATTSRPAQGEVPPASRIPHRGGMHWRDPRPHEHEYVNRKNFHSINVQVTCDLSNSLNFPKPLCNVTLL